MRLRPAARLALGALLVATGLQVVVQAPAGADASRTAQAADLLDRHARAFDEPVKTTVTTAYDLLIAFAAAGTGDTAAHEGRAWYLLDALERRTSFAAGSTTLSPVVVGGVGTAAPSSFEDLSRVLHIATVYDQDPTDFAGRDLVSEVKAFAPTGGSDVGWFRTTRTGSALVPVRSQARGVLALDAAGEAAAASAAATALVAKQRPSGAFARAFAQTAADLESTAYAIEALVAEGSSASVAAADKAAAWLVADQQADGSFAATAAPDLVGLAADALDAAGRQVDAGRAAAYVETLQVLAADDVDPVYAGAIAPTAAARARLVAGTFDPLGFSDLVTATLRGVLALDGRTLAELSVTDPGSPRPPVEGDDTSVAGPCEDDEGVTVVVDFGYIAPPGREEPIVRCALGTQVSGWASIENAGIPVSSVPGFEGGALCQLDAVPAQGFPYCWLTEGYWSYWHGEPGEPWTYSQLGASNRAPAKGSVEGWRFVPLDGAGVPPKVGPTFTAGVDVTAPLIAFTGGPEGTVESAPGLTFPFSIDDLGAAIECRLDGEAWTLCDQPTTFDVSVQQHTLHDVPDGDHTLTVRATDTWDNATTISRDFTVVTSGAATIGIPSVSGIAADGATVEADITAGELAQTTRVEVTSNADHTGAVEADPQDLSAGDTATRMSFTLAGLQPSTTYHYRVVAESSARTKASDWLTFETSAAPARPAKTFTLAASKPIVLRGTTLTVSTSGLEPGEAYAISLSGTEVAQGEADAQGKVSASFVVPSSLSEAKRTVRLTGASATRTGSTTVWTVKPKTLSVARKHAKVRATYKQTLTITGLAPGESVKVVYRGKRVSATAAKASSSGRYVVKFAVGSSRGTKKVSITGLDSSRKATKAFTVTRKDGSQGGAKGT